MNLKDEIGICFEHVARDLLDFWMSIAINTKKFLYYMLHLLLVNSELLICYLTVNYNLIIS